MFALPTPLDWYYSSVSLMFSYSSPSISDNGVCIKYISLLALEAGITEYEARLCNLQTPPLTEDVSLRWLHYKPELEGSLVAPKKFTPKFVGHMVAQCLTL